MKLSFLWPHLQLYGGTRRVLEISNRLVDRGHEVYIFHTDGSPPTWMEGRATFKSLKEFFGFPHDHLLFAYQDQVFESHRANAKHRYYYNLNLYERRNILLPSFISRHVDKRAYFIRESLLDPTTRKIANCSDTAEWATKHFGLNVDVVFGGINPEVFHPVTVEHDPNITKIYCLGSPKYWKGTSLIEAALDIVKKKHPNIVLDGYYRKGLAQSEMAAAYSSGDIFVDAQLFAGWNNPIAEAMACGVPVICHNLGFNKDIAIDRETALLVPPRDAQAMAAAITELIEHPELRKKLATAATKKIAEFTWDRATDTMENIFRDEEKKDPVH